MRDVARFAVLALLFIYSFYPVTLIVGGEFLSGYLDEGTPQLITKILEVMGLSELSVASRYSYYFGGRPLRLCGDVLSRLGLVGLSSDELIVGAFVGGSWVELPHRIFTEVIKTFNGFIQYVTPHIVTSNSCLEVVLPDEIPEEGSFTREPPPQVRGSNSMLVVVKISDESYEYEIPLYLYLSPSFKDPERATRFNYDYDPKILGIMSAYRTNVRIPIVDLVIKEKNILEKKLGMTSNSFDVFLLNLVRRVYEPINNETEKLEILERPPTPIPDGGGGGGPTYNYVERRPVLFNNIGSGGFAPVIIKLTSSNRSYAGTHYLVDGRTSWQLYNPYVTIFSVKLLIYGNDSVTRSLRVSIDGEQKTYTIYPNRTNEVTVYKYYYEYPGRAVTQPVSYTLSIEPAITTGRVWSIEGEVRVYYSLNTTALNNYLRSAVYDTDLFSVMSWRVILSPHTTSEFNYTYRVSSVIPSPYGGYVEDGTNMGSVEQDYVDVPLYVIAYSPKYDEWAVNYTIRICLGGILCGSKNVYLTKQQSGTYVTVRVKPTTTPAPQQPLYNWLVHHLHSGSTPLTIELIPNQIINLYPYSLYMEIIPYNTNQYRVKFYYKNIIGYKSPSINVFQYTSLCKWVACSCEYDNVLGEYQLPYSQISLGVMHSYADNRPNVYGSSTAYISILRHGIGPFTGAVTHIGVALGLPSLTSVADNLDESTQVRYSRFRITLQSPQISVSLATYGGAVYDPGPGATLPDISKILSHIAFMLGIISYGVPQLGVVATILEFFAEGYDFFKTSLSGNVYLVERTNNRITVEYSTGTLYSTSAPLTISVYNIGLAGDCPQLTVTVLIRVVYPYDYAEVSRSITIPL